MGLISFRTTGSFQKTKGFLNHLSNLQIRGVLESYGQKGVAALAAATPEDTGLAASSWGFEVSQNGSDWKLTWTNSDIENGFPVAVMIQYGHGTGTGGYIPGYDYINPAIQPIFEQILNDVWKEVTSQ